MKQPGLLFLSQVSDILHLLNRIVPRYKTEKNITNVLKRAKHYFIAAASSLKTSKAELPKLKKIRAFES